MNNLRPLRPKKWSRLVLIATAAVMLLIASVNVVVDNNGIIRTDFRKQIVEPNRQYIKMKYLLAHPDRFDSFVFGSSRVNSIDITRTPPGRFYNMTYSEGVPEEHLANIRMMLRHGIRIRHILLGLDDFSSRVDPSRHLSELLRQPHPEISGKSMLKFYSEYYIKISRFLSNLDRYITFHYLTGPDHELKKYTFDIYANGRAFCSTCDDDIERDPDTYRKDPKFLDPFHYDGNHIEPALAAIAELKELSRVAGFQLTVFINPIHHTTYLDTDLELFARFKRGLARITDYYDFSGLNSVTRDNYNYYETSHYRPFIGDKMLARMFGSPKVAVPEDFGVLVTSKNVEEHIRQQAAELQDEHIIAEQTAILKRRKGPARSREKDQES